MEKIKMRCIEGKLVLLGSKGVGKTRLITSYIKNTLHKDVESTVGLSFFTCKIMLDEVRVKLQVWDTAGQERYKAVGPIYYRNANAALLVFDLSKYKSFTEIKSWVQELHRNVQEPMVLTLVGNKLDLHTERAVSYDEAYLYATSIGAAYFETSAEIEQGIEQIFQSTALGLVRLADEGKSRSLRQFNSCESIAAYAGNNTAFSHFASTLAESNENRTAFRLPYVHIGVPVDGQDVKVNGVGRLETPSWSIENIAWGEEVQSNVCCL